MSTNWTDILENSYKEYFRIANNASRLEFLSEEIFDFTTYDSSLSEKMAANALRVADAITFSKTFEFIENVEDYELYITYINLPFFRDRLDWGTSIRGAWWTDWDMPVLDTCGIYRDDTQWSEINFKEEDWKEFIKAVLLFGNKSTG